MKKVLGFIIIALVFCALYLLLQYFLSASANVRIAIFSVCGTLIGAIICQFIINEREIAARHYTEKKNAYMPFINLCVGVMQAQKKGEDIPVDELMAQGLNYKKELLVWGCVEVIVAMNKYEEIADENDVSSDELLLSVENVFRAMRKDLGHSDASLEKGALIGIFLDHASRRNIISKFKDMA